MSSGQPPAVTMPAWILFLDRTLQPRKPQSWLGRVKSSLSKKGGGGEREKKKKKKAKMADAWLDKDDFWYCSSPFVLHSKVFRDGGEKNALCLFAFHNAHPLQILYRIGGVKGVSPHTMH